MNKFQILVVEDDSPIRNLIATTLKTHNYKYLLAQNEVLTEDTEYTDKVIIHALFSEEDKERLKKKITEATSGRVTVREGDEVYFGTVGGEVIIF